MVHGASMGARGHQSSPNRVRDVTSRAVSELDLPTLELHHGDRCRRSVQRDRSSGGRGRGSVRARQELQGLLLRSERVPHGDGGVRALRLDGGAIGFYFIKHADETWSYRRSSWRDGYPFRPGYDEPKMTLQEVIERGDLRWQRATAH